MLFQLRDIINDETSDRSHTPPNILPIFELVTGIVTWQAIRMCTNNYESAKRNGTLKKECTGIFRRTIGLPCSDEWEVIRRMPAESGPPSFQVQDFHPFWLWSSKRQHACYRPWRIIPQPPLASTALAALSSMDNIEGSLDPGAPVQGIVSEDEEEALEELATS